MSARPDRWLFLLLLISTWSTPALAEEAGSLLPLLLSGTEGERARAASRLYHVGGGHRGVPLLVPRLVHTDPNERSQAAQLLGMLRSGAAVVPLVSALADPDWAVRRDAAEALGQVGDPRGRAPVTALLTDPHQRVRIGAARALGEIGGGAGALATALASEQDPEVRLHLVQALGSSQSAASTRALVAVLTDPMESIRLLAATVLVERGHPRATRLVASRLRQGATTVERLESARTLARATGPAAQVATTSLAAALTDPSLSVGLAAATSLTTLGDVRGRAHLERVAASDAPPPVRAQALELLGR